MLELTFVLIWDLFGHFCKEMSNTDLKQNKSAFTPSKHLHSFFSRISIRASIKVISLRMGYTHKTQHGKRNSAQHKQPCSPYMTCSVRRGGGQLL